MALDKNPCSHTNLVSKGVQYGSTMQRNRVQPGVRVPDNLQSAVYLMKWMEGKMRKKFEMLAVNMRQKIGIVKSVKLRQAVGIFKKMYERKNLISMI
jgi:hypothetical protein